MTAPSPYSMLDTEKKCSMSVHHCSILLIQLLQQWIQKHWILQHWIQKRNAPCHCTIVLFFSFNYYNIGYRNIGYYNIGYRKEMLYVIASLFYSSHSITTTLKRGRGVFNWLIYSIYKKIYIYFKCPTFSCHWLSELKEGSFVSNGTTI